MRVKVLSLCLIVTACAAFASTVTSRRLVPGSSSDGDTDVAHVLNFSSVTQPVLSTFLVPAMTEDTFLNSYFQQHIFYLQRNDSNWVQSFGSDLVRLTKTFSIFFFFFKKKKQTNKKTLPLPKLICSVTHDHVDISIQPLIKIFVCITFPICRKQLCTPSCNWHQTLAALTLATFDTRVNSNESSAVLRVQKVWCPF